MALPRQNADADETGKYPANPKELDNEVGYGAHVLYGRSARVAAIERRMDCKGIEGAKNRGAP